MENKPKLLDKYINYLTAVNNYSEGTIIEYTNDLLLFFKFLKEYEGIGLDIQDFNIFVLAKVGDRELTSYLIYLNYYRNNGAGTRARKIYAIRNFYKWLSFKYPKQNIKIPMQDYFIEQEERLPKCLSLEEVKKIKGIFNKENSRNPERNNLIIDTFLITGMRITELSNIRISHIEGNYIKIIAKWNKERKVYITNKLNKQIQEYILNHNINDYLFTDSQGNKLDRSGISEIVKNAYKYAGIGDKGYTTHTLRHTSATILYQHTDDILIVKEFLGHNSILSSQVYTHIHNNKVKEAVDKNPLNIV